jgi:hypothetical protein
MYILDCLTLKIKAPEPSRCLEQLAQQQSLISHNTGGGGGEEAKCPCVI